MLYSLTALAFGGAVDRAALEGSDGTVLEPLAEVAGPAVHVLGSAFAVLAVGLGSVYACLGLYNQVIELRPQSDRRRRFAVGAAAPTALFALVIWLLATDQQSFTAPLGYAGALTAPLVGGLFPMMLVVAARRRGELVPSTAPGFVGHPLTALGVGGLFAAAVALHGLVIWDAPLLQAAALGVTAGMVAVALVAWRRGGFRARSVVELRREPERDLGVVGVTVAGERVTAPVELDGRPAEVGTFEGFSRVRSVTVRLPDGSPTETAVWAHHVTPDGDSVVLAADVDVSDGTVSISLPQAP